MEEAAAAAIVTTMPIIALDWRRARRYKSANTVDINRTAANATAANPPCAFNQAKYKSESHSQANHAPSGFEYEKMSCAGTAWLAAIHSPVRICQPVSQSPSRFCIPSIRPKRNAIGMRNAKSSMEGRNLIAILELFACIFVMPSRNLPPVVLADVRRPGRGKTGNPYNSDELRRGGNP